VLEVALLLLLVDLSQQVTLTVPHLFDGSLLGFHVSFGFLAAFDAGLEFKVLLFEVGELVHQLVFLLYELLKVLAQLRRLHLRDAQLCLQLSDPLLQLGSLEVCFGGILDNLFLGLAVAFDLRFKRSEFEKFALFCGTFAFTLQQLILLQRQLFAKNLLFIGQNVKVLLGGDELSVHFITAFFDIDGLLLC